MREVFCLFGVNNLFILLLFFFGCTKTNKLNEVEAEKAFRQYIHLRFSNQNLKKQDFLKLTTGIHHLAIDQLTDAEFKIFNDLSKIKKESFKVLSIHCASLICSLRYNLTYVTQENKIDTFTSTVEKAVELRLDNGSWKISEIADLNTQHVGLEPLTSYNK